MVDKIRCGECSGIFSINNKKSNTHSCPKCKAINVIEKSREYDNCNVPISSGHLSYKEYYLADSYVECSQIMDELSNLTDEFLIDEVKHFINGLQFSRSIDLIVDSFEQFGTLFDNQRKILESCYILEYTVCVLEE